MVRLVTTVLVCVSSVFIAVNTIGCGGGTTTRGLDDATGNDIPADTNFQEVQPFSSIDTTDEAVFDEAELSEELARRIKEALQPVYFDYNSFKLSSESIEKLTNIGTFLKENAGLRILIEGHCDERGSSEYNIGLGENRARVVKDYLVNYGIKPVRLEVTSMGEEQPAVMMCGDEACHAQNRRAEFTVLAR